MYSSINDCTRALVFSSSNVTSTFVSVVDVLDDVKARSLTLESGETLRDCSRLTLRELLRELALLGLAAPPVLAIRRNESEAFSRSRKLFSRANS